MKMTRGMVKAGCGAGAVLLAVLLITLDPVTLYIHLYTGVRVGSELYRIWESPPVAARVRVFLFNITNAEQFLSGEHASLRLEEVGPFTHLETRSNSNMSLVRERGVLRFQPRTRVRFLPELSVGDPRHYNLTVPNVPLLALSTLISEQPFTSMALNMLTANLASEPALRLTAHQFLWGYPDQLVDMANTILPGWIDFPQFGILDRMYSEKDVWVEVESADTASQFAIRSWDGLGGLPQRAYTRLNTSTPCNRLHGAYEGILYSPGLTPDTRLRVYRKQICRILPLRYAGTFTTDFEVDALEFKVEDTAFDPVEENSCLCPKKCLPRGLSDLSPCYYKLPLALSWPHLMDADPALLARLQGMRPNRTLHETVFRIEPRTGVPVSVVSSTQTNLLVGELAPHMRGAEFSRMLLPLCWMHMEYEALPAEYRRRLRWALVLAPYLLLALEGVLLAGGALALLLQARNHLLRTAARSRWRHVYQTVPARPTDDKVYIHENPTFL